MPSVKGPWEGPVRRAVSVLAFLLTVIPGYYALASTGQGRVWLRAIAAVAALVLTVSLLQSTAVDRLRKQRRDITRLQVAVQTLTEDRDHLQRLTDAYREVMARIVDREKFLYRERVHLVVDIGTDDGQDFIREVHTTTPEPFLSHRTLRLIVPSGAQRVNRVADLDVRCEAPGDPVNIDVFGLVESVDLTRALLVFYPGISEDLSWEISYRPAGLWAPLRRTGRDALAWDARAPEGVGPDFLSGFSVTFVFPHGSSRPDPGRPDVAVHANRGKVTSPTLLSDGRWQVEWRDPEPAAVRYTWELVIARRNGPN